MLILMYKIVSFVDLVYFVRLKMHYHVTCGIYIIQWLRALKSVYCSLKVVRCMVLQVATKKKRKVMRDITGR